ncbi:MAG: DUF1287 domain-containing protein [Pseudomonadota bacterium]
MKQRSPILATIGAVAALFACGAKAAQENAGSLDGKRLADAAMARTLAEVSYDPSYMVLAYPGGDVPADTGVCSDVVVRALRALDIDLQVLVHEDMRRNFSAYPALWGLSRPDRNIDHRRVPNLETYFTRIGARLPFSRNPGDYQPGDIVAWNLRGDAGALPHIGIVTGEIGVSGWPKVVHNIGAGPELEDVLFAWPLTGRYRVASALSDRVAHEQSDR